MDELTEKMSIYLSKKRNPYVSLIMKDLGLEEYEVLGIIELLKQKGYLYDVINGRVVKVKPMKEQEVYKISNDLDHIKLLLISDTHLASVYDRLDILRYLYVKAEDEEVNYILHSGDLTEGLSGRPQLRHGTGGSAYAKSYKLQKYLDNIDTEERPHILQMGHIHQAFYMKQGKTHCFQTSCLQDLTPYCRSLRFSNDKSCWWLDVYMNGRGEPVKIKQELETFGQKRLRKTRG